jgi:AP endonuclease-2
MSFCDLPEDQQIGGYPTAAQLASSRLDAATLDSEGRCVILEFPAFVLIGVYSPTNRDDTRYDFCLGFLYALDARVRNLVAAGKRVFLTGDLNISRDEIDTANAEEQLRKHGMTGQEYVSKPSRRLFNQLLLDGKVFGDRDEGREQPVLLDICRSFHPNRKGMFTCWETKINARPGNFGSRIDYVLCSLNMRDWFCDANIQEGLLGSDHCPVYAVIKDTININGAPVDIKDIMNADGMFKEGVRLREWAVRDLLPMSAKLIPEFDRRRNIRDMFAKKPPLQTAESSSIAERSCGTSDNEEMETESQITHTTTSASAKDREPRCGLPTRSMTPNPTPLPGSNLATSSDVPLKLISKRPADPSSSALRSLKRSKSNGLKSVATVGKGQPAKGQSSLIGFFKPKAAASGRSTATSTSCADDNSQTSSSTVVDPNPSTMSSPSCSGTATSNDATASQARQENSSTNLESPSKPFRIEDQEDVVDPIVTKETWSKLLSKRAVPRCEHNEPCISYVTKKPGVNCGRSFYMCARPLGPSGIKERGTKWCCGTFIWSSDWTGDNS